MCVFFLKKLIFFFFVCVLFFTFSFSLHIFQLNFHFAISKKNVIKIQSKKKYCCFILHRYFLFFSFSSVCLCLWKGKFACLLSRENIQLYVKRGGKIHTGSLLIRIEANALLKTCILAMYYAFFFFPDLLRCV